MPKILFFPSTFQDPAQWLHPWGCPWGHGDSARPTLPLSLARAVCGDAAGLLCNLHS